jgi:hypothetical protein
VSKPTEPQGNEGGWNSSSWVGIDGLEPLSNDVLQGGIQQRVDGGGAASYVAWYEWYAPKQPNSPPYINQQNITNFPVSPGQNIWCTVQYLNNKTLGYVAVANIMTGAHTSFAIQPPPGATFAGNCAEWIMEAPDGGYPTSALPNFSPVTFNNAYATLNLGGNGDAQTGDYLNILNGSTVMTSTTLGHWTVAINFLG